MAEQEKHHPDPPEENFWQQFKVVAKEEILWLLSVTGTIALSLAIGRLIQRLTGVNAIDPSILRGGEWQGEVDKRLRERGEGRKLNGGTSDDDE